jgi:CRP-like cAMP-binding protein
MSDKRSFRQRKSVAKSFNDIMAGALSSAARTNQNYVIKTSKYLKALAVEPKDKTEKIRDLHKEGDFLETCFNEIVQDVRKGIKVDFDQLEDEIMNLDFCKIRESFIEKTDNSSFSSIKRKKTKVKTVKLNIPIAKQIIKPLSVPPKTSSMTLSFKKESKMMSTIKPTIVYPNTVAPKSPKKMNNSLKQAKTAINLETNHNYDNLIDDKDKISELEALSSHEGFIHKKSYNPREKYRVIKRKGLIYDSRSDDEIEWYNATKRLIEPTSLFKSIWDNVVLFITLYTMLIMPYNIAFDKNSTSKGAIVDACFDIIFIIDVVIQFFIPVKAEGVSYTTLTHIAIYYLSGWFLLDLLSAFPINLILTLLESDIGYYKISRIIYIFKLNRLLKLIKIISRRDRTTPEKGAIRKGRKMLSNEIRRLSIFIFYFFALNHVLACIWIFIGTLDYPNWISENKLIDSSSLLNVYVASLYFNLVTIFAIGYGDIVAKNRYEYFYCIVLLMVGLSSYTYAISHISYYIENLDERSTSFNNNKTKLENFSRKYKIPLVLYRMIRGYLTYDYKDTRSSYNIVLNDLPYMFRNQLAKAIFGDFVKNFKFFNTIENSKFIQRIIVAMKQFKVRKDYMLINEGDYIEELLFVKRGVISINKPFQGYNLTIVKIKSSEHYGDIEMLMNKKSEFNIRVKSHIAELYLLKKTNLFEICSDYPDVFDIIAQRSSYNSMQLNKLVQEKLKKVIDPKSRVLDMHSCESETESLNSSGQEENIDEEFNQLIVKMGRSETQREGGFLVDTKKTESSVGLRRQSNILESPIRRDTLQNYMKQSIQTSSRNLKGFKQLQYETNKKVKISANKSIRRKAIFATRKGSMERMHRLKGQFKQNILEGSMNLKDPRLFYFNLIKKKKAQGEFEKANKKLDLIIKLFEK